MPTNPTPWLDRPYHRQWLRDQAEALFAFYGNRSVNPSGGFYDLDVAGRPISRSTRCAASTARRAWCTASPSRACSAGRAPTRSSITA